jgi:hypothetical protein
LLLLLLLLLLHRIALYCAVIVLTLSTTYLADISRFSLHQWLASFKVLGYGWAGLMRKYVVQPAHMWWPGTLVQVSLFQ